MHEEIIRESGLNPAKMTREWALLERGVSTWIRSKDLEKIVLEIYNRAKVPSSGGGILESSTATAVTVLYG